MVIEGDDPLAVTVPAAAERTELERSPAFRAYTARLEAGLAHLGGAPRTAAPAPAPAPAPDAAPDAAPAPAAAPGRVMAA